MALIKCPECGKEISNQSDKCIHCGYPLKKVVSNQYNVAIYDNNSYNAPTYFADDKRCPCCGSKNYHAFVEEVVVRPSETQSKTTLNLNPLKPFTIFNHKEKVSKPITKKISRLICDNCGKVFN